jgi:hypothetical protein
MARSVGDSENRRWAVDKARAVLERFEEIWWYGVDTRSYADSLVDPGNEKVFQPHWIGLTSTDAVLPRLPFRAAGPLASQEHGNATLNEHEQSCYTGEFGLFHTGTGPTSAAGGNRGDSCDPIVSQVQSERAMFGLNTSIMAVAEGNYGRLGQDQQQVYTTGNARIQLDPTVWETPGAMPEIAPSPDSPANIGRPFYDRSMALQAWGAYGILWPVVHQQLGVDPDLGYGKVAVVPQLPEGQQKVAGSNIRVGRGAVDVSARLAGKELSTEVTMKDVTAALTVGAVLPDGAKVQRVTVDGHAAQYKVVTTSRGTEVHVPARGAHTALTITLS